MTESVKCPRCGHAFALSDALADRFRAEAEEAVIAGHHAELHDLSARLKKAEASALDAHRRAVELERSQSVTLERAKLDLERTLRKDADRRLQEQLARQSAIVRQESEAQTKGLEAELLQSRKLLASAQAAELTLRQQADSVAVRSSQIELEIARRLDEKRIEWQGRARALADEEYQLKGREKDKTIDDLRRLLEEARRKSEQGSQSQQGEVLELDFEAALAARFPRDVVRAVPKGMNGADVLHEVRDAALNICGTIAWETKNTKHWQPAWIAKLKDDQRARGAALAVIVTTALPPEASSGFALIDGVWVAGISAWPALAGALREQLIQITFARGAATGMTEKMDALYRYLAGDAFRHKVETIVEAFSSLKTQLDRERRAMERLWKEREKEIERVIGATAGMYGELRGTIGQSMRAIPALELEAPE